jgi:hypothetical protein
MADSDSWSDGLGVAALCLGIPLALFSATAGLRCCRYLVGVNGFLMLGLLLYCPLLANLDKLSISQHGALSLISHCCLVRAALTCWNADVIIIGINAGVVGAVLALRFWRQCLVLCSMQFGALVAMQCLAVPFGELRTPI